MDLIEEKWRNMLSWLKKMTLKKAMALYAALGLAAAFGCTFFVVRFAQNWREMIALLENPRSVSDLQSFLSMGEAVAVIVTVSGICFLTSLLFYKNRIESGLTQISQELECINRGDLSYDCGLNGDDEIAAVCRNLNAIRQQLAENRRDTWSLMEQQRLVNAAFAHDIRNPLTVMKGHLQMLEKFYPSGGMSEEKIMESIRATSAQIGRMEQFAHVMKNMSRMDEWKLEYKEVFLEQLLELLHDDTNGMLGEKDILCSVRTGELQTTHFYCDLPVVQEVTDNLIMNAMRYARSEITVVIETSFQQLLVYVRDDGKGFSEKSLAEAARPYFTTEQDHIGMGLAICRMLCRKHGGDLELANSIHGGGIICARFKFSDKVENLLGI